MAIRTTRQSVEALGPGDGKARITRQVIEVLGRDEFIQVIEDSLGLTQTLSQIHTESVFDTISLSETVSKNIYHESVVDDLALVETVDKRGPIWVSVGHLLQLQEPFVEHLGVVNRNVTDALVLEQRAGRSISVSVGDTISLTQNGERSNSVIDTLALVQTATGGKGGSVEDDLALVSTVGLAAELGRSLSDTLLITHAASYWINRSGLLCEYNPQVGFNSGGEFTPPSTTPPVLGSATLTLSHPFDVPTSTVVLRNPRFGNRDRLSFNRISRKTRGGTLIVFADPQWPKTQTLQIEIDGLRAQQADELRTFLAVSLGQEVRLLDHENREWRGLIMNPDTPISQPARNGRSVTIEFQGVLV